MGSQVFVSGLTAPPSQLGSDALAQARAALALVVRALAEAGAEPRHVVRTVVYVTDMADAPLAARAHAEVFGGIRPASTLLQVAALNPSAARIAVEATAVVDDVPPVFFDR